MYWLAGCDYFIITVIAIVFSGATFVSQLRIYSKERVAVPFATSWKKNISVPGAPIIGVSKSKLGSYYCGSPGSTRILGSVVVADQLYRWSGQFRGPGKSLHPGRADGDAISAGIQLEAGNHARNVRQHFIIFPINRLGAGDVAGLG